MIRKFEPVRLALKNEKVVDFVQNQYIASYKKLFFWG